MEVNWLIKLCRLKKKKILAAGVQALYNVLPLSVDGICEYDECHSYDEVILSGKGKEILQIQVRTLINDFELIKMELILDGPDLIRYASRRESRGQRLEASEIVLLALTKHATMSSTAARQWILPREQGRGCRTSDETPVPADTWTAILWYPDPRAQLSHAWTPDPGKLNNKSIFFIIFYWGIVDVQYYISFRCTT